MTTVNGILVETIHDKSDLGTGIANADEVPVWDVSAGNTRMVSRANFVGATLTGGGTVATGGFTLTVPQTGTAALRDAANTFTGVQTVPRLEVDDANHYIDTDAAGALAFTSQRISMLDNATIALGMFIEFVFVLDASTGNGALFLLRGGVNSVQEIFDPSAVFTTTKDTAASYNVYYEAGNYYIQNKRGGTRNVTLFTLVA